MSLTQKKKKKKVCKALSCLLIPSSVFSHMISYVLTKHHGRENTQQLFGHIKET